jgi:hypothetical protein
VARRLPEDPDKRRLQIFKRAYQNLEHWRALIEDRGMDTVIPDPGTGEDIYIGDLMVGIDTLPRQQRAAFELICLKGYTETAARDVLLPHSKSSTPVQQYADSGLARMVKAYDAKQAGLWPPVEEPKLIKKPRRRSLIMAVLHPIVRQGLEKTRKEILVQIEGLKTALKQVDDMLVPVSIEPITETLNGEVKPDLKAVAKEMAAAGISE